MYPIEGEVVFYGHSKDIVSFSSTMTVHYDHYLKTTNIKFPIFCLFGNFFDNKVLFEVEYEFKLKKLSHLQKVFKYKNILSIFTEYLNDTSYLDYIIKKGNDFISNEIIKPVPFTTHVGEGEFIKVDENTSFYGNFNYNDVEGCYLEYGKNNNQELTSFILEPYLSVYNLSGVLYKSNEFYKKSRKEIFDIVSSYGLKELINFYKKSLKDYNDELIDQMYSPYYIKLSGNDDDSWTKYFYDEDSMLKEVYRLRRTQPINKTIDVIGNGYIFTN